MPGGGREGARREAGSRNPPDRYKWTALNFATRRPQCPSPSLPLRLSLSVPLFRRSVVDERAKRACTITIMSSPPGVSGVLSACLSVCQYVRVLVRELIFSQPAASRRSSDGRGDRREAGLDNYIIPVRARLRCGISQPRVAAAVGRFACNARVC